MQSDPVDASEDIVGQKRARVPTAVTWNGPLPWSWEANCRVCSATYIDGLLRPIALFERVETSGESLLLIGQSVADCSGLLASHSQMRIET